MLYPGLFLERAREPVALYFAIGLSLFAGSEPGGLSLIWRDILDSCGLDNFCRISKKYTMGKKTWLFESSTRDLSNGSLLVVQSLFVWKWHKNEDRWSKTWKFITGFSILFFRSIKFERNKLQICSQCHFKGNSKLLFCSWISSSSDNPVRKLRN